MIIYRAIVGSFLSRLCCWRGFFLNRLLLIEMIHLLLLLRLLTLRLLDHFMCYEYLLEEGSRFPFHLLSNVEGLQAVDADQHAVEVHHGRDL